LSARYCAIGIVGRLTNAPAGLDGLFSGVVPLTAFAGAAEKTPIGAAAAAELANTVAQAAPASTSALSEALSLLDLLICPSYWTGFWAPHGTGQIADTAGEFAPVQAGPR
jgi:hypothetical protein